MQVFVSWSGSISRDVAEALRDWLPRVIEGLQPWLSCCDILPGHQWFNELSTRLRRVEFGIVCVARTNKDTPWLLFETGALLNALGDGHVIPYLIDCSPDELAGPLDHFQSVRADKNGTKELVLLLAAASGSTADHKDRTSAPFDVLWPELNARLSKIHHQHSTSRLRAGDVRVLTPRELQILRLLVGGKNIREIARDLSISVGTLKAHVVQLHRKLAARSLSELIETAKRLELVDGT